MTEAQWASEPHKFEEMSAWDEFLAWGEVARCEDWIGTSYPFAAYDLARAKAVAVAGMRRVWL